MERPLLAITMGDAAGVGPEIIAAAWPSAELHAVCRPFVVGNVEVLRRAVGLRAESKNVRVVEIDAPEAAAPSPPALPCLAVGGDDVLAVPLGSNDARSGQAAYEAIVAAAKLAQAGRVAGIVTAPISKAALWMAGHKYPGHTELLAELCGVSDFAMMLYLPEEVLRGENAWGRHPACLTEYGRQDACATTTGRQDACPTGLGVVHVTLHMALRDVFDQLTTEAVLAKIRLADAAMRRMLPSDAGGAPRIGVCALNPHAGEEGLFGDDESRIIAPAVRLAQAEGIDARGPFPTDTLMVHARHGAYDAVVAMYHDQGHIALKLLGMHGAVNVTLGLPIVRTSVAHGTAFDIAGRGLAEYRGLISAAQVASQLAEQR